MQSIEPRGYLQKGKTIFFKHPRKKEEHILISMISR